MFIYRNFIETPSSLFALSSPRIESLFGFGFGTDIGAGAGAGFGADFNAGAGAGGVETVLAVGVDDRRGAAEGTDVIDAVGPNAGFGDVATELGADEAAFWPSIICWRRVSQSSRNDGFIADATGVLALGAPGALLLLFVAPIEPLGAPCPGIPGKAAPEPIWPAEGAEPALNAAIRWSCVRFNASIF